MTARRWVAVAIASMIASIIAWGARPAVAGPNDARGEVTASCEFFEISAKTADKAAIDSELKRVEKKLKKPPFSTWNQFKLLSHAQKSLAKKKAEPIALRTGSATATLVEIVDKSKVRLTISMDDDKGKQVVNNTTTVEAGDFMIYVHPLPNNEAHLLSWTCN
jgi:hypothetical protein